MAENWAFGGSVSNGVNLGQRLVSSSLSAREFPLIPHNARTFGGQAAAPLNNDELRPPYHHSSNSSARASSVGGTSRPSDLAVFRLIINSNLVGRRTGKSEGLSPLRISPT